MLFEDGKPSDYVYPAVNNAFEAHTGLKDVVGRKASEVLPGLFESTPDIFEQFAAVVATGRPARFEAFLPSLGKWFSVAVHSLGNACFVSVFDNITDLKLAQAATEERTRLTSLGADVGLVLTTAATLGEGLQQCAEAFLRHTGAVFARIWTLDERAEELELMSLIRYL